MLGASAVAILSAVGMTAPAQDTGAQETVVVTGFRASLEKAQHLKRSALDSSDSILAEDIAKFPDMNVSESLQRIPGVSLARDSGEGREITVRGLSAQFTRVRINGMEVLSTGGGEDVNTSGGNSGVNRGRAFDFNVFASELFSALTVHKSASADVEEGSLGATVDMHTARPFDHPGFTFTAAGQMGYHQLGGSGAPRVAALISDTFLGGKRGVLVSGAYGMNNTLEEGVSDIRTADDMGNNQTSSTSLQFASVRTGAGTG
jgi:TonB-dependent receptor